MSTSIDRLKSEVVALSEEERAELAHFLINSLALETKDEIESAWNAEISRRLAEIRSGKIEGKPAEQVFAEIRARFP